MEIPYAVQPRADTGLYNAKAGIWLFLASEVMLFGALFSAYVLLRVGAVPGEWPHGWLNVTLGTINTLVLALSAITTLLAWVACKTRQFDKFKFFHACTLLLALTFLCIKGYEYHDKWIHYEIQLNRWTHRRRPHAGEHPKEDYVVIEGRYVADEKDLYDLRAQKDIKTGKSKFRAADQGMEKLRSVAQHVSGALLTLTGLHALHILGGSIVIGYLWGPGRRMWKTDPERFTNRVEVSGLFWHFVDLVWIFCFLSYI